MTWEPPPRPDWVRRSTRAMSLRSPTSPELPFDRDALLAEARADARASTVTASTASATTTSSNRSQCCFPRSRPKPSSSVLGRWITRRFLLRLLEVRAAARSPTCRHDPAVRRRSDRASRLRHRRAAHGHDHPPRGARAEPGEPRAGGLGAAAPATAADTRSVVPRPGARIALADRELRMPALSRRRRSTPSTSTAAACTRSACRRCRSSSGRRSSPRATTSRATCAGSPRAT